MPSARKFVAKCTFPNSCKCNVCLRQPPTLRNLASHSVFHHTFNLSEFKLTGRTLFYKYVHAANPLLFPSISWFRTRASLYSMLTCITHCASAYRGLTTIACPHPMYSGVHSTLNTVLAMRKLSRHCVLKGKGSGVLFAIDPCSCIRNVCWTRRDIKHNRLFEPISPKLT